MNELETKNATLVLTLSQVAASTGLSERTLYQIAWGNPVPSSVHALVMDILELPNADSVRQHLIKLVQAVHVVDKKVRMHDRSKKRPSASNSSEMNYSNDTYLLNTLFMATIGG